MNPGIFPEKKKKQPARRYKRLIIVVCFLVLALPATGILIQQRWHEYQQYQRLFEVAAPLRKIYAPDGVRYVTLGCACINYAYPSYLFDPNAGKAYEINGLVTLGFYAIHWSADSRYVVLNGETHYGSGRIHIFDVDAGQQIWIAGYNPCDMFTMNFCRANDVLEIAPVSPLVITRDGALIHLNDGTYHRLYPDVPGVPLQVRWRPDERRLFMLMVVPDSAIQRKATLAAYFGDKEGEHPVKVLTLSFDETWYGVNDLSHNQAALCEWNADETGVDCLIHGQRYTLADKGGKS